MVSTLVSIYFCSPRLGEIIKTTNYIKFQAVDPKIFSILIFQRKVWVYFCEILIFQEKYFYVTFY